MAKKEVAVKPEGEVQLFEQDRPDYINQGTRGQEGVGMEDLTIPRVELIQDISPQRKKTDSSYIEGAEEGMLFNTVTNELYGNSIMFIPVFFRKEYVIWKNRKAGGGFKGAFPTESEAKAEMEANNWLGEVVRDKDQEFPMYEVMDTHQQFGMIIWRSADGSWHADEAVISMSRSKMKPSRQWNSMIKMAGGDRFSKVYEIRAIQDSGDKGDYFNYAIKPLGFTPPELYARAEILYESIAAGQRDVNRTESAPSEKVVDSNDEY